MDPLPQQPQYSHEEQLRAVDRFLREDEQLIDDLRMVRELGLPDACVAAGYIRNTVWDRLFGHSRRELHQDIDVVYFDPGDETEARDFALEKRLIARTGNPKWSVKNQARMHIRNREAPYRDTADAMSRWPETVTAIGAYIDDKDELHIVCPHGLTDLFAGVVRRSPFFTDHAYYLKRVRSKRWGELWPSLTILE
ncbi:nucleotidyltransferase family protein [Paenibacillus koleovorans]|uniref:nucleotidyltransferase family protein n=1 Tax=Paenibacillus koleovorans TaxID=121608 RepID=UPI000FD7D675|nr:nucleotidyltransferase family protein [Paenibacillus koleovorans]